jgi:group I intron endonuclease
MVHFYDARNRLSRHYKCVFHDALLKYGDGNFIWEVLDEIMFSDLLLDLEKFYIAKYNCMIPNGYNMTLGGEGTCGRRYTMPDETKKKLSIMASGRRLTEETKKKIGKSLMGRVFTKEHKDKIRTKSLGRKQSEASKEKNRLAHLGKRHTEDAKKKMGESRIGNHNRLGKPHSVETKIKLSEIMKGRERENGKFI